MKPSSNKKESILTLQKVMIDTKPKKNKANKLIKKSGDSEFPEKNIINILKGLADTKFPDKLLPMLATLVDKPFEEPGWMYEVKLDGYRALSFCNKKRVEIKSRNDKSFNEKFYTITRKVITWNIQAVIDGEIIVANEKGVSNFGALQNWRSEADGELLYYVFDMLWYNGKDLTTLPLIERRNILKTLIPEKGSIRLSQSFEDSGIDFFATARKLGMEGIIAKKMNSKYIPGERTNSWLKIKANKRQEMVIGGFTINDETRKQFSSLLVGVYENGKLQYTGKIGTGFNDNMQRELMNKFKLLTISESPFQTIPDINKPSRFRSNPPHAVATWLRPELVCEVSFAEMTSDGVMRHPSFEGMRIDKKAKDVVREFPTLVSSVFQDNFHHGKKITIPTSNVKSRKTLINPNEDTQVKKINGHELKFTHLSKIFWPKENVTKGDMLNYYYQAAPYILPYLVNRPQSMNRHPNGIEGESFYYKDVTGKAPEWIETFVYHSDADDRDRNYLIAKDESSLLYMANLGCVEMNPWSSRVETENYPDWCIIDLDPADRTTFDQVIEAALVTKEILDRMGVTGYPKTSGSTGIHIYIPLGAKYTYEQSKEFARIIATMVHEKLPKFTSIERAVKDRGGKMYVDFLQNRPQATVSAPYSLRPKPGATVSMPLHWHEVKKGLCMKDFTIHNAIERIKSEGDIFKPVLGKGIDLTKALASFNK